MIISEARKKLAGDRVKLADWLLAPLYLQRGTTYWLAHRPAISAQQKSIYEVIFTTIAKHHWDHLWKLKLTTDDAPGVAQRLCRVLEEFNIRVLTAECSVHSLNRYNSMSFILSMRNYDHHLDGSHPDLANPNTTRVAYLELSLLSSIAGNLVFHQSGRPRFEFTPMRLHSHFRKEDFDRVRRVANLPSKGEFSLSEDIISAIAETCGNRDVFYSGAVDTENRLIRLLFFPEGQKGVAHVQVSGPEFDTHALNLVLGHVLDAQANILRFQVRRGLNNSPVVSQFALNDKSKRKRKGVGAGRFDITFESATDARTAGDLVEAIRIAVANDEALTKADIHVTEPSN